jgi:hypothetical protein
MSTTYRSIHLKGAYSREEAIAADTVKPGYLIELTSAGTVQAHSEEGGVAERAFAVEDTVQGNDVDDSYSAADRVQYNIENRGNEVFAYIKAGEDIDIGDKLVSAGDGTLIEAAPASSGALDNDYIAVALEALDLTGSGAVATRLKIRIL